MQPGPDEEDGRHDDVVQVVDEVVEAKEKEILEF